MVDEVSATLVIHLPGYCLVKGQGEARILCLLAQVTSVQYTFPFALEINVFCLILKLAELIFEDLALNEPC